MASVQDVIDSTLDLTFYQKMHLLFVQYSSMVCGMHTFVMVFYILEPVVLCKDSANCAEPSLTLHNYCMLDDEDQGAYNVLSITRMYETFQLDCSTLWQLSLIGVCYFIGSSFGTLFLGGWADKVGRRFVFMWSNFFLAVFSALTIYVRSLPMFFFLRILHGATSGSLFLTGFIYETEMFSTALNAQIGCLNQAAFAWGYIFLAISAYYWPTWIELSIIPSIFALALVPWCFLHAQESPQWYASRNDVDSAKTALKVVMEGSPIASKLNGLSIVPQWSGGGKAPFYVACSTRPLFFTFLRMSLLWICTTCAYYGLSTSAEYIGGSVYVNTAVLALMEIPAQFLATYMAEVYGNKNATTLLMLAAAASCAGFLIPYSMFAKVSVMCAQLCATAGFTLIYIYAAEVYPTEARSICVGSTSSFGRIGAMSSMGVRRAGMVNANIPIMSWGLCALGASFVSSQLPETTGTKPPETIEEFAHRFGGASHNDSSSIREDSSVYA